MTNVDLYQQCPCGSGKKLKFCCGAELAHDLDAIGRAIEGQQRVAALELVQRAIATKGPRPALIALQIQLGIQNQKYDVAEAGVRELLRLRPKDPAALATKSIVLAMKEDVRGAVDSLHDALEAAGADQPLPAEVGSAFHQLGLLLLARGSAMGALTHLVIASQLHGHKDRELLEIVQRLNTARDLPLACKELPPLALAPDNAPWKGEFDVAIKSSERALWRRARNQFRLLAENQSQEPAVLKNLAITQTLLGDPKATAAAWRHYARLPSIPLDDAVEAELVAQLEDAGDPPSADVVEQVYPILDMAPCMEHLLSDRRCHRVQFDSQSWDPEDGPAPKGVFVLLDRLAPVHGADLQAEDMPQIQGHFYIFGKQTDRPARLVTEFERDDRFEVRVAGLLALAGQYLGEPIDEQVAGKRDLRQSATTIGVMFPLDVPASRQTQIIDELREKSLLQRWTKLPLWECGGKTALQAALDPKQRIALLAVVLDLELALLQSGSSGDGNALRKHLGLPALEAIDPTAIPAPDRLPLIRLARVQQEKLDNKTLSVLVNRVTARGFRAAQRLLATEAASRTGPESADLALAGCEVMVSCSVDYDEAFGWIEKGRQVVMTNGGSPARIKILELEIRALRGEFEIFAQLLNELLTKDLKEDRDSAMLLYATMTRLGLVTPEGKFMVPRSNRAPAGVPEAAALGATTPGGLWTPGSGGGGVPAAPPPPGKSKLWVPGMD